MKIVIKSFPGHKGRPGKRGGSLPRGSSISQTLISKPITALSEHKIIAKDKLAKSKFGRNKYKVDMEKASAASIMQYSMGAMSDEDFLADYWGISKPSTDNISEPEDYSTGDDVFNLFEGVSPRNTGHEVVIVSVGGSRSFVNSWKTKGKIKPSTTLWNMDRMDSLDRANGGLTFYDPFDDKEFYVEQRMGTGEWLL